MNPTPDLDRVFPLSGGSAQPPRLRAPNALPAFGGATSFVMGNRAFMRTWAARRIAAAARVANCTEQHLAPAGQPSR
jgi:hypothetical protein